LCLANTLKVSTGQYTHLTYRFITMMRGGLLSMLYTKATEVTLTEVDPSSSLTLMSADVERIVNGMQTAHEIWANTIEVVVAIYLLSRQLGVACAIPIAVAVGKFALLIFQHRTRVRLIADYCSVFGRVAWCHKRSHETPSSMARRHREAHRSHDGHAGLHQGRENVRSDRCLARRPTQAARRGARGLQGVPKALDLDYGIL
jgi:hypothetical protein